ncbi:MAG: hypothetical protein Q9180_005068 [Flavoplaca navasiana]
MPGLHRRFAFLASAACIIRAVTSTSLLFHGTSVVIFPSHETPSPANSTLQAANFFCYMTDQGYFSFGWSVFPSGHGNTSHCRPDSNSYHWYEYAARESCDEDTGTCLYRTQNVPVRQPSHADPLPFPARPLNYIIRPLDVGNYEYGQMAVSYIDDGQVMVYGVGTRQILGAATQTDEDCKKAYATLEHIHELHRPKLAFELQDPCVSRSDAQEWNSITQGGSDQARLGEDL